MNKKQCEKQFTKDTEQLSIEKRATIKYTVDKKYFDVYITSEFINGAWINALTNRDYHLVGIRNQTAHFFKCKEDM